MKKLLKLLKKGKKRRKIRKEITKEQDKAKQVYFKKPYQKMINKQ